MSLFAVSSSSAFGDKAEEKICRWLLKRGTCVMRYPRIPNSPIGPRLLTPSGKLIAPDIIAFSPKKRVSWIEAKHKVAFSWHRATQTWQASCDNNKFWDYVAVSETCQVPVWLLFLMQNEFPAPVDAEQGAPEHVPTGLYGAEVQTLARTYDHMSDRWGAHGMIYFRESSLQLLARKEEFPIS